MTITQSNQDLRGHVALVVGGSRGIGAASARLLASRGASVAIVGRDTEGLENVRRTIADAGGTAVAVTADATDSDAASTVVGSVTDELGAIGSLVYSAGRGAIGRFEDLGDTVWKDIFELNVHAAMRFTQAVLPGMQESKSGRIVMLASTAAKYGTRFQSPYNASKHAMLGMVKCLALEAAPLGITVNAVCPGYVDTEMLREALPAWAELFGVDESVAQAAALDRVPLGRMLEPEEIAELVAYLVSDAGAGVTGQGLTIDGGLILI